MGIFSHNNRPAKQALTDAVNGYTDHLCKRRLMRGIVKSLSILHGVRGELVRDTVYKLASNGHQDRALRIINVISDDAHRWWSIMLVKLFGVAIAALVLTIIERVLFGW